MRNKRKGILMACSILGSAAIVSTGFAAWVVTSEATAEATGNIQVDTVKDERVALTYTWKNGTTSRNVTFGTDGKTYANDWLTPSDLDETITDSLTVTAEYINEAANQGKTPSGTISVSFKILGSNGQEATFPTYTDGSTLVVAPTYSDDFTLSDGKVTIPVNFTWGTAFGTQNPNQYFNSQPYDDDLGTEAYNKLHALEQFSTSYTYEIVLTYKEPTA